MKKMKIEKFAKTPLTFKVAGIWTSPEGTTERQDIDVKTDFDKKDIDAAGNLTGDLMLIKLREEISAIVTDAEIPVHLTCNRCLKSYVEIVKIPTAEREFLIKRPPKWEDINDVYLIDMKNLLIDLTEMLRQEIILHFPLIPVCSKSCKGICQVCGSDRNKKPCGCKEKEALHQPFKDLKKMIKK
jgi:uncharacterized protein